MKILLALFAVLAALAAVALLFACAAPAAQVRAAAGHLRRPELRP